MVHAPALDLESVLQQPLEALAMLPPEICIDKSSVLKKKKP